MDDDAKELLKKLEHVALKPLRDIEHYLEDMLVIREAGFVAPIEARKSTFRLMLKAFGLPTDVVKELCASSVPTKHKQRSCGICNTLTEPPHDRRAHKEHPVRPWTDEELIEKGLVVVKRLD